MGWFWYILGRWAEKRGNHAVYKLRRARKAQEKYFCKAGLNKFGEPPEQPVKRKAPDRGTQVMW